MKLSELDAAGQDSLDHGSHDLATGPHLNNIYCWHTFLILFTRWNNMDHMLWPLGPTLTIFTVGTHS